jgi:hypothetical protein
MQNESTPLGAIDDVTSALEALAGLMNCIGSILFHFIRSKLDSRGVSAKIEDDPTGDAHKDK